MLNSNSYIRKLKTEGYIVRDSFKTNENPPKRIRQFLQQRMAFKPQRSRKPSHSVKYNFWVSPLNNPLQPEIIHKHRSSSINNQYTDLTKSNLHKYYNIDCEQSYSRQQITKSVYQLNEEYCRKLSKSLILRHSTPKQKLNSKQSFINNKSSSVCKTAASASASKALVTQPSIPQFLEQHHNTTPNNVVQKSVSFLSAIQQCTGINLLSDQQLTQFLNEEPIVNNTLIGIYKNLQFNMTLGEQSLVVKNCVLQQVDNDNAFQTWFPKGSANKYKLIKEMKRLFGQGQMRTLTMPEESQVIKFIRNYLKCNSIIQANRNLFKDSIRTTSLEYLTQFPVCFKQMECYWKILISQYISDRLSYQDQFNDIQLNDLALRGLIIDFRKSDDILCELIKPYIKY